MSCLMMIVFVQLLTSCQVTPDKKQVNVGLTVSKESGVPFQSNTIKGRTADLTTVEGNVKSLRRVLATQKFLQITDGGMLTPANVHFLEQEGIEFLAPWQADTALLDLIQEHPVAWEELSYRGAQGQDRYWATELGIPVIYEEELSDQRSPSVNQGKKAVCLNTQFRNIFIGSGLY